MENKLFESSVHKLKRTIKIEVYENCCRLSVLNEKGVAKITYHDLIGILEAVKQDAIWTQREYNLKKKMLPKSKSTKKPRTKK